MPKKNIPEQSIDASRDFEKALHELESLVEQLERGDLSLEDSLKLFERGINLSRFCQVALTTAEQKVRILSERPGESQLESLDLENDSDVNQSSTEST